MLDDSRVVVFSLAAVAFVLIESGGKVPTSLSNVHFVTFARNLVDTRSGRRIKSVLVDLRVVPDLVEFCVENLDVTNLLPMIVPLTDPVGTLNKRVVHRASNAGVMEWVCFQ